MNKLLFLIVFAWASAHAQKVANYSFGTPATDEFEKISFWQRDDKRSDISYEYGKKFKEVTLTYAGTDTINGKTCFKIKFPNAYVLYVIPTGKTLELTDKAGKYKKVFSWMYEGPINGIGTFCDVCAEDEDEAMDLVSTYFMQQ